MEHQTIKLWLIGMVVFFTACYYDNEEELYPPTNCITENMSYQTNIVAILERNCYVCHSTAANNGNVTLDNYDDLIVYVNNGKLLGAINREPGYSPMPQNAGKLPDCDIAKIESWVAAGAPNN